MNDIYFEMYNDMVMIEGLDSEEISAYYKLFVESKGSAKLGKKAIKIIEEIKNTKPSEFTGPIDVKQYVDKNYKILIDTAELLEKDIKNLRKDQVKLLLTGVIAWLGGFIVYGLAGVAGSAIGGLIGGIKGAEGAIIGAGIGGGIGTALGGIAIFFSIAYAIIKLIINYVKLNEDWTILKDLNKIKTSLKTHLKNKKLKDADRKKISKIIEVIDDAQEECNQKIIMSKESVDIIKLNIYEAYDNGEITYGEKEYLLEKVNYIYEADKADIASGAIGGALTGALIGATGGTIKASADKEYRNVLKEYNTKMKSIYDQTKKLKKQAELFSYKKESLNELINKLHARMKVDKSESASSQYDKAIDKLNSMEIEYQDLLDKAKALDDEREALTKDYGEKMKEFGVKFNRSIKKGAIVGAITGAIGGGFAAKKDLL